MKHSSKVEMLLQRTLSEVCFIIRDYSAGTPRDWRFLSRKEIVECFGVDTVGIDRHARGHDLLEKHIDCKASLSEFRCNQTLVCRTVDKNCSFFGSDLPSLLRYSITVSDYDVHAYRFQERHS